MRHRSSIAAESRIPRHFRTAGPAALLPLLLLAACVDTKPRAEVQFRYADFTGSAPPQLLSLAFDDGAGAQPAAIRPISSGETDAPLPSAASALYETRTDGSLAVHLLLARSRADTLASGVIHLPLQPDWRWSVEMFVAPSGTMLDYCSRCAGWQSFAVRDPLRPGAADTLYVTWAGASLSRQVAY